MFLGLVCHEGRREVEGDSEQQRLKPYSVSDYADWWVAQDVPVFASSRRNTGRFKGDFLHT